MVMMKSRLLGAVCACICIFLSFAANASIVTYNGTDYNVTATTLTSYDASASQLQSQVWWGDSSAAMFFADSVGDQLGVLNGTGGAYFLWNPPGDALYPDAYKYDLDQDLVQAWSISSTGGFKFAVATVVPIPAAVWLFGSGLIGLVGLARRKKV